MRRLLLILICIAAAKASAGADRRVFTIRVVDDQTGRGVPLVELKTVNHVRHYTDSAGIVAFDEPGLMDRAVFFHVRSHGYEYPRDGFGYRGKRLQVTAGGEAELRIKRINIAQRLYRVTGAGIYRDSLLAGQDAPTKRPVLNGQVLGSDSVVNAIYRGKIHWFWGDTNRPSYPLGNFHVPGAVSDLPDNGGLDPDRGVDLRYFLRADGFAKSTAEMPGKGPTWINALMSLRDSDGGEQLLAAFVKVQPPLTVYQRGLARFDDEAKEFKKLLEYDLESPLFPEGHPLTVNEGGVDYLYFAHPFPVVRVPATPEAVADLSRYEAFTCLKRGGRKDRFEVERRDGAPVFAWKPDTIAFTPQLQSRLIRQRLLKPEEALFRIKDHQGKAITMHRGSVAWNDYRGRWIMIGTQSFGTSALGEIWYAEADRPEGPWIDGRKVITHEKYSFYNPKHHPMFDKDGGREIFFEGTYTTLFSGNEDPTPRYDYNQIMYKLDLSDPRLRP